MTETGSARASERVIEALRREVAREATADTYLFLSRSRARARASAEEAAGELIGRPGKARSHPDCLVFDPDELGSAALKVEHVARRKDGVKSVEEALLYRPVEGGRRILLLFEVDRMGPDAQAALLKTCEEPPPGTALLLTAADLSPILPALRSRSRIYRLGQPTAADLEPEAVAAGIPVEAWPILVTALGSGLAALELNPSEREALLEQHAAFQLWLAGRGGAAGWLQPPEGQTLADQREGAARSLAAALGWLARAYPEAEARTTLRLDRTARLLVVGLRDLRGQLGPGLVLEDLLRELEQA